MKPCLDRELIVPCLREDDDGGTLWEKNLSVMSLPIVLPASRLQLGFLVTWVKLLLEIGQVTANGTSLAKRVGAAGGGSASGAPDWCPNSLLDPYTPARHILIFLSVSGLSFPFAFHYFGLALT